MEKTMNKTSLWAVFLVIICTIFTSVGQIFFKLGSEHLAFNLFALLTNYSLITGLVLYAIGAFLLIFALKGGELSVLYPIIATSFVWVTFLSSIYFNESITLMKWAGVFLIVYGISVIGKGGGQ